MPLPARGFTVVFRTGLCVHARSYVVQAPGKQSAAEKNDALYATGEVGADTAQSAATTIASIHDLGVLRVEEVGVDTLLNVKKIEEQIYAPDATA